VAVYADRIEWAQQGGLSTGKAALGAMTLGTSLLKTGISKKQQGSEVIPVKAISSVTTKKDGLRFTNVSVICAGNTIDFRVSHNEAEPIKQTLTSLMLGSHPAQQARQPPSRPPLRLRHRPQRQPRHPRPPFPPAGTPTRTAGMSFATGTALSGPATCRTAGRSRLTRLASPAG
jgi:hypothetical protein